MALGLAGGAMNGMNTVYGNTGFLGIPLAFTAFGDAAAVPMAAIPTGAGSFVMAQQYGVYVHRTSSVILLLTIGSVLTLFWLLHQFNVPT
jgi:predicted permease